MAKPGDRIEVGIMFSTDFSRKKILRGHYGKILTGEVIEKDNGLYLIVDDDYYREIELNGNFPSVEVL